MEKVLKVIEIINMYTKNELVETEEHIYNILNNLTEEEWQVLWDQASGLENNKIKIILCMESTLRIPSIEKYEELLLMLINCDDYTWDEKYYLYWQVVDQLFRKSKYENDEIIKLKYELYRNIYKEYAKNFEGLKKIEKRNKNLVLVTVQQFLSMIHAPTKTTLDRAYVLKKILGKQVIIINTAEQYGGKRVPFPSAIEGTYIDYIDSQIMYKDTNFPYMQFDNNMPNIESSRELIHFVQKYKPEYIVNVGGNSLLMDLCNEIIPVLNINTVSTLVCTDAYIQSIGRKLNLNEEELLKYMNKTKDNIIEGRFTLMLQPQKYTFSRKQLDIAEKTFIMTVVGTRLTDEITEEFIKALHPAFEQNAMLFIIGNMNTYEEYCKKDSLFRNHAVYLGIQEDLLALIELCDLYVNPNRIGGGISAINAIYKGCPVVTLRNGDVATNVGSDFCVETYEEMSQNILKYMNEKEYYNEMSNKALIQAEKVLDSNTAFTEIIDEFERRVKKW